jgi:hypothetical protein
LDVGGDAELPGASGGDDELRCVEWSSMVVVVVHIGARWCVGGAGGARDDFRDRVHDMLRGLVEAREERGVFIEGLGLQKWLGFRRWRRGSDGGGGSRDWAGLCRKEQVDRWVPPVSGWATAGAYPFGYGCLAGLGRLSGLG